MTDQEKIKLRKRLEGKSSDELRGIIAANLSDNLTSVLQINIEARVRLHECKFHNHPSEERLEKLLDDTKSKLHELFKELSLNARL